MIHAIRIRDSISNNESDDGTAGEAFYSNQYIHTPNYLLSKKYSGVVKPQLGEMQGFLEILKLLFEKFVYSFLFPSFHYLTNGAANTAIIFFQNRLFLGYEANFPFEIRWDERNASFSSIGYETFDGVLNYPFTAHPKIDPVDGNIYFHGYNPVHDEAYPLNYGVLNKEMKIESYFKIPLKQAIWSHDMAMTENYVLLIDHSMTFNKNAIFSKESEFFSFDPSKGFAIALIPKKATKPEEILWFNSSYAYGMIHSFNAWEERRGNTNEIVLIAPLSSSFNGLNPDKPFANNSFHMKEIRLDLTSKSLTIIDFPEDLSTEFPTVHPDNLGRKARYGFSGGATPGEFMFNSVLKYDLHEKKMIKRIPLPTGYIGSGEPVIIPRSHVEEKGDYSDNVYLAVIVTKLNSLESEWVVYDGKTMNQEPVVRLSFQGGKRIPQGFHGLWLSEEEVTQHTAGRH
jgi:carotenoid cleavage dioxygenase-like enzyme